MNPQNIFAQRFMGLTLRPNGITPATSLQTAAAMPPAMPPGMPPGAMSPGMQPGFRSGMRPAVLQGGDLPGQRMQIPAPGQPPLAMQNAMRARLGLA